MRATNFRVRWRGRANSSRPPPRVDTFWVCANGRERPIKSHANRAASAEVLTSYNSLQIGTIAEPSGFGRRVRNRSMVGSDSSLSAGALLSAPLPPCPLNSAKVNKLASSSAVSPRFTRCEFSSAVSWRPGGCPFLRGGGHETWRFAWQNYLTNLLLSLAFGEMLG